MLNKFRSNVFWLFDKIKGNSVKNNFDEIEKIYNGDEGAVEKNLNNILKYAVSNIPYYYGLTYNTIEDFPIVSKSIIKGDYSKFISPKYDKNKLIKISTSGSTGTPFTVYQDSMKRNRLTSDLIYAHNNIDWKLGDHYIFIRNWVSNYKQSYLKNFAQNVTNISISQFDDYKKIWLLKHLKKHKNSIIFGYASSICDFLNFIESNNLYYGDLHVKLIVCDSDRLSNNNKRRLEKVFDCPVINRYDNEENGLIAITKPYDEKFYINYPSLFVELLKIDSDDYAKKGEIGRVVITDLFNYAMPLIRYDTGDFAISQDEPGNIKTLEELAGRQSDYLLSIDGKRISGVAISGITEVFDSITKYQLKQIDNSNYVFSYIGSLSKSDFNELDNRLHDSLGKLSNIQYINVEYIESELNGKFKTIIPYTK